MRIATTHTSSGTIAILLVAMALCLSACRKDVKLQTNAVENRAAIPMLRAHDVVTLISDSGITRYRIMANEWHVYDKAKPPYWEFPNGVDLQKFDDNLNEEAFLRADYAYYNEDEQIWRLRGNVHASNLKKEEFFTEELYWNQKTERVYSDSAITIRRATSTIHGVGFESNQEMTKYTILKPTGIIPVKED